MTAEQIGYALACVLVPVAWGLVIVWISNRLDRRFVARGDGGRAPHSIEYHI
jgi:hypothetical protein